MSALFSTLSFQLGQLVNMIEDGSIGLPEIQRPFVWKKTKVRDLFDSMYRGFPVGYFCSGAIRAAVRGRSAR
jgi:uncharacterized protein with ParB-like and HNH nuclease domain